MTSAEDFILRMEGITKSYRQPDGKPLVVLRHLNFSARKGEMSVITGVSGSGKSTLLHLIGGLDAPDEGDILFHHRDVRSLNPRELSRYRNQTVGFVFQFHYLMPELTVRENTSFPFLMHHFDRGEAGRRSDELLEEVGLSHKRNHMPYQLSGGERQRVAIARSLVNRPKLLLADEPTGNIDTKTATRVFDLFRRLIHQRGLTCLVVTHNEHFAEVADSAFALKDGKLEGIGKR